MPGPSDVDAHGAGRGVIRVGDRAPDFELPGTSVQAGVVKERPARRYRLSDDIGHPVVLVFFSAAFTPTWTQQVLSVESNWEDLDRRGARPLGISCDNPDSLHPWAASLGCLSFPLLGDFWPHGAVCSRYGTLNENGVPDRVMVVVAPDGTVAYIGPWDARGSMEAVRNACDVRGPHA